MCWRYGWATTRTSPTLTSRSLSRRRLLPILAALSAVVALGASAARAANSVEQGLYQQRAAYKTALINLSAGRTSAFRRGKARLADYPLYPYLEYRELRGRLSSASADEVLEFREIHDDLPVAHIMFRSWLKRLGQRRDWQAFLKHYEPSTDTTLRCYHLRALYGTGSRDEAFDGVAELWTVAKSQPKSCDPLFEVWIDSGKLTASVVWQRLQLALKKNQRQLARYLQRFFEGPYKPWAQSLYNVHVTPTTITRTSRYSTDNELSRQVIAHGLERLAGKDSAAADKAWQSYRKSHDFSADERASLDEMIMIAQADDGVFPTTRPAPISAGLAVGMAQAAVAQRNWSEAYYWIEQLPADQLESNRWQYWFARSLATTHLGSERARLAYRALAEERDYYGFLAAERIGSEARLNRSVHTLNAVHVNQLRRVPSVNRAAELYAVGDLLNARREWNRLIPELDPEDQSHAGYLALQMGWTRQGI